MADPFERPAASPSMRDACGPPEARLLSPAEVREMRESRYPGFHIDALCDSHNLLTAAITTLSPEELNDLIAYLREASTKHAEQSETFDFTSDEYEGPDDDETAAYCTFQWADRLSTLAALAEQLGGEGDG